MCGILGVISNRQKLDKHLFKIALSSLRHRGPDGSGIWEDGNVMLGHRRLSILDLSKNGKQPFVSNCFRYVITFNGEIYNFLEIKKELEILGHSFYTDTDTEILLNAYIEWGKTCFNKFNGMWALVIWDKKEKSLFFSRDRFGKKPLFYAHIDDMFIFASEMKAIYPYLKELRPNKNFEWMKNNLFLYETTEECLIDGIKRFPAGHHGLFVNNTLTLNRYWNTLDHLQEIPVKYEDQVERFRELFVDACKIRMYSDVPIGTALSGGFDSSATICTMSHINKNLYTHRISQNWQHAFVASFPEMLLDESPYAKRVTDFLGIKGNFLDIDPLKSINSLEKNLYMFEELYLTSPIPMIETYKAIKKANVSVTIDGHGADELLSGYGISLFEAFLDAKFNFSEINNILDTFLSTRSKNQLQYKPERRKIMLYGKYMLGEVIRKFFGKKKISKDYKHKNYKKLDHFNRHLYYLFHETILPTLLRNYDRYSMINSVEVRMPFMDHRLVSYSFSLPWHSKIKNGYTKNIARDAMQDLMPKDIAYRKTKVGFNSPVVNWMQNELKDYLLDTINSTAFRNSSTIDYKETKKQIKYVIENRNATWMQGENAWNNLTPFLWEQATLKRKYQEH